MENTSWELARKPYDLRERLFQFAGIIVRVVQFLHTRGPVASALSYQSLKCGTSAGTNYEEADDGSSARDTLAKRRIALRELKETRFRLRVLRNCELLSKEHDPVIDENDELVREADVVLETPPRQRSFGKGLYSAREPPSGSWQASSVGGRRTLACLAAVSVRAAGRTDSWTPAPSASGAGGVLLGPGRRRFSI